MYFETIFVLFRKMITLFCFVLNITKQDFKRESDKIKVGKRKNQNKIIKTKQTKEPKPKNQYKRDQNL